MAYGENQHCSRSRRAARGRGADRNRARQGRLLVALSAHVYRQGGRESLLSRPLVHAPGRSADAHAPATRRRASPRLSVSPLTWSHAEFVTTCTLYLERLKTLQTAAFFSAGVFPSCKELFRYNQLTLRSRNFDDGIEFLRCRALRAGCPSGTEKPAFALLRVRRTHSRRLYSEGIPFRRT